MECRARFPLLLLKRRVDEGARSLLTPQATPWPRPRARGGAPSIYLIAPKFPGFMASKSKKNPKKLYIIRI